MEEDQSEEKERDG